MKSSPEVEFYRNGAVCTVLKRYDFHESEKQIIEEAIRTAKLDKPNMKVLAKSDALLKMVASSREPILKEEHIDEESVAKAVAQTNMKKYKAPQSAWTKPIESNNSSSSLAYRLLAGVIVAGIITYSMKHHDGYTLEEAKQLCQEKNEVLPLTIDDFMESSYKFGRPSQFWLADGDVMMTKVWEQITASADAEHSFICVPEHGHKGEYAQIYSRTKY